MRAKLPFMPGLRRRADHCTRCGNPFSRDATAYMVEETVVRDEVGVPPQVVVVQRETVPVCDSCVTAAERAAATVSAACKGCQRLLRADAHHISFVCSIRCQQEAIW